MLVVEAPHHPQPATSSPHPPSRPPLQVCTTVTTTRKLVSVLSSIAVYGHSMSAQRWLGVALAAAGVLGELETKFRPKPHAKLKM